MDRICDRRAVLKSSGLALLGLGFVPGFLRRALASVDVPRRKVLVSIFQRGAVDGLSMVPPVADPVYAFRRPAIAIPPPGSGPLAALDLDGHFALHPALASLKPLWDGGTLAIVHAAGSPDPTRSHFDAQDFLDSGTPGIKRTRDGWLTRAIQTRPETGATPFRAVALQPNLPRSLAGRAGAVALNAIAEFGLPGGVATSDLSARLEESYGATDHGGLHEAGRAAFEALHVLRDADPSRFAPEHGAIYPAAPIGRRLKEIAQLVKADLGLEVAVTDCGGWDTHAGQGASEGQLANRLRELGAALAALEIDLGARWADVCVVTMTEFGRTVRENGTRGTDHGHGSVMLVLGGGVKGKRVLARWKSLQDENLWDGRDLPVTTDHREVLGEILKSHMGVPDLSMIFPGFASTMEPRVGLF